MATGSIQDNPYPVHCSFARRLTAQLWRLIATATLLFGCVTFPVDSEEFRNAQSRAPFVQRLLQHAWVATAESQMIVERAYGPITEQRILLTNKTSIRGDNMILLRAHGTELASVGRLRPAVLLRSTDALFPPFTDFNILNFSSRVDMLGVLNWAEWSNNAGLSCVLAFRRLDGASRIIPSGAAVIDMVLRNCVNGSVEQALAPALPAQAGFAATDQVQGRPQMLSPLAGPAP